MRSALLLLLLIATSAAAANSGRTVTTLRDLGVVRPERLAGLTPRHDFYLPLASRDFFPASSSLSVSVQPSPFVGPESIVSVLVNDREVATRKVGAGGLLTLTGRIPAGTKADDPANNILKLTIRATLALPAAPDRNGATTAAQAWIEVLPESAFTCSFAANDPDWLAVARLPFTLAPRITVVRDPAWTPAQQTLALRLVAWLARTAPRSELHFTETPADPGDLVVIEAPKAGAAALELTPGEAGRTLHLRAATVAEADAIWFTLRRLAITRIPGAGWTVRLDQPPTAEEPATAVPLTELATDLGSLQRGRGELRHRVVFERSALGAGELTLRLTGHAAAPDATLAVLLNNTLVATRRVTADQPDFAWDVDLPTDAMRGVNEVTLALLGPEDAPLVWQIHPDSALLRRQAAAPPRPESLLEAARGDFASGAFAVVTARPELWPVAADIVAWLQRVNPRRLLAPFAADLAPEDQPAVVIGSLAGDTTAAKVPVTPTAEGLAIASSGRPGVLRIAPSASTGFWQLVTTSAAPRILADFWGQDGRHALAAVSAGLARAVWIEDGDVVIGDGTTPPLTFATRDRHFSAAAAPTVGGTDHAAPAAAPVVTTPERTVPAWRWLVVAALWIVLTGVVLWIFDRTRRHAAT